MDHISVPLEDTQSTYCVCQPPPKQINLYKFNSFLMHGYICIVQGQGTTGKATIYFILFFKKYIQVVQHSVATFSNASWWLILFCNKIARQS